jgi:dolichol-phosphate mannosyltransferase
MSEKPKEGAKVFVMIPTYNEAENIGELTKRILEIEADIEVVVVDDNSPDGTAGIVRQIKERDRRVHLVFREREKGRGTAGIAGFRYALDHGAEVVIEMDADFSHDPKHIPEFLEHIRNYDVVVGSRFVHGGRNVRKGLIRNLVTRVANIYIRTVLGINIRDATSGYRCFRREVLEALDISRTISIGPSVVQELLYKAILKRFTVHEIPITFVDRYRGISSFNFRLALQGFIMVLILRYLFSDIRRLSALDIRGETGAGAPLAAQGAESRSEQGENS